MLKKQFYLVILSCLFCVSSWAQTFYLSTGVEFNQTRWKYTNIVNKVMDGKGFGHIYANTGFGYSIGFKNDLDKLKLPLLVDVSFMQTTHSIIYESGVLLAHRYRYGMGDYHANLGPAQFSNYEIRSSFIVGLGYQFLKTNPRWSITTTLYYANSYIDSEGSRTQSWSSYQNEFTGEDFKNYKAYYGTQLEFYDANDEFSTHNIAVGVDLGFKFKKEGKLGLTFRALLTGVDKKRYVFEEEYEQYNFENNAMETTKLFHTKNLKINSLNLTLGINYSL